MRSCRTATGTITNDDATPTVSVSIAPVAATVVEDGDGNLVYTVTLNQASAFETIVTFSLTGTATSGTDYAASGAAGLTGSITIAAGLTTGTITVNPTADDVFEANETVIVTLTGGTTNAQPITVNAQSAPPPARSPTTTQPRRFRSRLRPWPPRSWRTARATSSTR